MPIIQGTNRPGSIVRCRCTFIILSGNHKSVINLTGWSSRPKNSIAYDTMTDLHVNAMVRCCGDREASSSNLIYFLYPESSIVLVYDADDVKGKKKGDQRKKITQ
jgi:hypothetical protein